MFRLAATLLALSTSTVRRATAGDGERGSVTLEQVLMSLGLFLLAVAVVAGITAAVNLRLAQIN
jgi:hypothetical protein